MAEKDVIEAEIQAISEYLEGQGVPGLHGGLTDREGFPRADVDVHTIRTKRQRLACLNTDHQAVMKIIEAGLQQHMAGSGPSASSKTSNSTSGNGEGQQLVGPASEPVKEPERAIAWIAEVTEGSPAALAGFQVDDRVVRFGSAAYPASLQDVAGIVRSSVGATVRVWIERGGDAKKIGLELSPRQWAGQGLIGMRLMPVTE